jgi:hypothetical protein
MIYQLPNGKIINISIETYLRMTDEDFKNLSESNVGYSLENTNPFEICEAETVTVELIEEDDDYFDIPDDIDLFLDEDFDL